MSSNINSTERKIIVESKRTSKISTSVIRKMFEIAEKAVKSGKSVINLSIGEPDFRTDSKILERAYEAMKKGYTQYTSNFGIQEIREAISELYKKKGFNVDPEMVMVTCGASEALLNISLAFIERGSEVIIPSPNFISYFTYAKLCEAKVKQIRTHDNNFKVKADEINEIMSKKVSTIFLNYPNNPTGAIADKRELISIAEIAQDYNAIVISDEIYDEIFYEVKPFSLVNFDNVIVVNGFSKSLAMTGWRIGYVIADKNLLDPILKVHQVNGVCAPAFAQKAVADTIFEGDYYKIVKAMVSEFKKRRDFMYKSLRNIGIDVIKPEGAFYMFPRVPIDCFKFVEYFSEKGVIFTPGTPFGEGNERYIRISYAASLEKIKAAMKILEDEYPRLL